MTVDPLETDPPLIVNANTPLAFPGPFQNLEPIRGRKSQILDLNGRINGIEDISRHMQELGSSSPRIGEVCPSQVLTSFWPFVLFQINQ